MILIAFFIFICCLCSCVNTEQHGGIISNKNLNDSIIEFMKAHPSKNYAIIEDSIRNHREIMISTCRDFKSDYCDYLYKKGDTIISYYNLSYKGHGIIDPHQWKQHKRKQSVNNNEIIHNADYEPHCRKWRLNRNGNVVRFSKSDIECPFHFESLVRNKELAKALTKFCRENEEKITYVRLYKAKDGKLYAIIGKASKYNVSIRSIYKSDGGRLLVVYLQNHNDVKRLFNTKHFKSLRTDNRPRCRYENSHDYLHTDRKKVQINKDDTSPVPDSVSLKITFEEIRWRRTAIKQNELIE